MTIKMLVAVAALAVPGLALAEGGSQYGGRSGDKSAQQDPQGGLIGQPGSATGMELEGQEQRAGLEMTQQEQKKLFESKDKFELRGTVQSIDQTQLQITLERRDLPPAELLVVSEQTKIKLNGKEASLMEIQPGAEVRARFQIAEDRPVALELDVRHKGMEKGMEKGMDSGQMKQPGSTTP